MRNQFDRELDSLNNQIIQMGALCEEVIAMAAKALINGDTALARQVPVTGREIDQMEREIESHCMKLLLHQQPVARDLRVISAALKLITDMERIGDQAEDIADIVCALDGRRDTDMAVISEMAQAAIKMVTDSVDAYVKKDTRLAASVLRYDDVVDGYFARMKADIIALIQNHAVDGEFALDLLMISKYFERIGDHAANIAEWVIYSATGTHKEA